MAHDDSIRIRVDLAGQRFGRLLVIAVDPSLSNLPPTYRVYWFCRCDCGTIKSLPTIRLTTGKTKSCGCLHHDVVVKRETTHGKTNTKIYRIWWAMLERCGNLSHASWAHYGGRGISVCERWKTFENFYADMGDRPEGKTLDRINVNGNYEPGNCRWATHIEQGNNRRNNRFITHNGETKTVREWERVFGFETNIIASRLRRGWSEEDALTRPRKPRPQTS